MNVLMYLRKSRADMEAEQRGEGDTLSRHRTALLDYARRTGLTIGAIYEEVVSGETIAARPQMQRLLSEVESGAWDAVLVMEVPRLARGDTADQGIVANTFKYSGTKIITPAKVYDPDNESDEEYFEFGLFMSRREYKMINRRLKAGRAASVREGKYVGSVPPFGFSVVKIKGEKGYMLEQIPEQAAIVRRIFDDFLAGTPQNAIATALNADGIPSARGNTWTVAAIRDILRNPHHAGLTASGYRPQKKVVRDGKIVISRPKNLEVAYFPGRHKGIVTEEEWKRVIAVLRTHKAPPVPAVHGMTNALSGLMVCDHCGKKMQRRASASGHTAQILCPTKGCPTVSHNSDDLESILVAELHEWLHELKLRRKENTQFAPALSRKKSAIAEVDKRLEDLGTRQAKVYDLLETGVYTSEIFQQRQQDLSKERAELISRKTALTADIAKLNTLTEKQEQLAPRIRNVLDLYDQSAEPLVRNRLLRSILKSVTYHKTLRTRWCPETDLTLTIHPEYDFL